LIQAQRFFFSCFERKHVATLNSISENIGMKDDPDHELFARSVQLCSNFATKLFLLKWSNEHFASWGQEWHKWGFFEEPLNDLHSLKNLQQSHINTFLSLSNYYSLSNTTMLLHKITNRELMTKFSGKPFYMNTEKSMNFF
jgi:hypothetical protein